MKFLYKIEFNWLEWLFFFVRIRFYMWKWRKEVHIYVTLEQLNGRQQREFSSSCFQNKIRSKTSFDRYETGDQIFFSSVN